MAQDGSERVVGFLTGRDMLRTVVTKGKRSEYRDPDPDPNPNPNPNPNPDPDPDPDPDLTLTLTLTR